MPVRGCWLALTRLEAAVCLVDDVGPPTAANHPAIAMARLQRLEAIANLHGRAACSFSCFSKLLGVVKPGAPLEGQGSEVKARGGFQLADEVRQRPRRRAIGDTLDQS